MTGTTMKEAFGDVTAKMQDIFSDFSVDKGD